MAESESSRTHSLPKAPGLSVAAAACNDGVASLRRSVTGEPRGPLCGMGVCGECRCTIEDSPQSRACAAYARDESSPSPAEAACDVLVIGAGPAGLAAAREAAIRGRSVILVDDNPAPGGQIWRRSHDETNRSPTEEAVLAAGVTIMTRSMVIGRDDDGCLLLVNQADDRPTSISFRALVLATGAVERFVPFPGWTLPGVLGAGGLQAMSKQGLDLAGKRLVIAGSGPLLFAVAAHAKRRGASVIAIAEQADAASVRGLVPSIIRQPAKLLQACGMMLDLLGVPKLNGWWPRRAIGREQVERVILTDGVRERPLDCDLLACGFGLIPRVRLAPLLGCEIRDGAIVVNSQQRTSLAEVFAAGECTGIGGVGKSIVEGRIAGAAAAGDTSLAASLAGKRSAELAFMRRLAECFPLRDELRTLAEPDTIICRCEDVPRAALNGHASWREAKLQTRCGMGPCQGCVCGPIVSLLKGWTAQDARPPIFNTPLGSLLPARPPASSPHTQGSARS